MSAEALAAAEAAVAAAEEALRAAEAEDAVKAEAVLAVVPPVEVPAAEELLIVDGEIKLGPTAVG